MKKNKLMTLIVLLMVIGFATITTTLIINGGANLLGNQDEFTNDILFTKAETEEGGSADITDAGKSITYSTKEMYKLNDLAKLDFEITNFSRQYDAIATIECIVDEENDLSDHVELKTDKNSYEIPAQESVLGYVQTKLIKSYAEENEAQIEFNCTLNVTAKERDNNSDVNDEIKRPTFKKYTIVNDVNSNGTADIGDEIQVNGENFYVIKNANGTIDALAKYNLNVGSNKNSNVAEGKQDESVKGYDYGDTTYGTVAFSNNNGWPYQNNDTINIQEYDGQVKDAINGYKEVVTDARDVRLITKAELEELINDGKSLDGKPIDDKADAKGYQWIYSTSYWSGSAYADYGKFVWCVSSGGNFSYYDFDYVDIFGVRPVIEVEA